MRYIRKLCASGQTPLLHFWGYHNAAIYLNMPENFVFLQLEEEAAQRLQQYGGQPSLATLFERLNKKVSMLFDGKRYPYRINPWI